MIKENIEEGVKRTAIVIWLIWVFIWSFADGLIEVTIIEWIKIFILQGDLFHSFNRFKYAFGRLGFLLFWVVVLPYIIYFGVVFIWSGFTTKFDDKNK